MATDRTADRSPAATGGDAGRAAATEGHSEREDGAARPRNDRGQYVDRMTEAEILDLLERLPGPVIASTDVAEHFDSTTEGARRKLDGLCDSGRLDRRKIGGTSVYWRPDGGEA